MGKLAEPELAEVEEHLLICQQCRETLERIDAFIASLRAAAATLAAEKPPVWVRMRASLTRGWGMPRLAVVGGLAAALVALLYLPGRSPQPYTELTLRSYRGAPATAPNTIPSGARLRLRIDLSELPSYPNYRLTIVDSAGDPIWEAAARPENGILLAPVNRKLPSGQYFVRLYPDTPGSGLLREFALEIP